MATEIIDVKKFRELINQEEKVKCKAKDNKYKNKTQWKYGLYFQSQKELEDYENHRMLHKGKAIAGYLWQGCLVLTEGSDKENKAVTYRPDIVVLYNDGTYEIREDKGKKTKEYIIKKKIIDSKFPRIRFKEC